MDLERRPLDSRRPSNASRHYVVLAALLWATTGLAGTLAPATVTPAALAEARTLIGGLALALVVLYRSGPHAVARIAGRPLLVSSAALAAFQWGFFAGVRGVGSAVAALLSAAVAPFAGDLLAAARARQRPGVGFGLGSLLMAAATIALASQGEGDHSAAEVLGGAVAAVSSGVAYAVYADAAARLGGSGPGGAAQPDASLALTACALLGAAVALLPAALSGVAGLGSLRGASVAAYLGIIATALAYAAFVRGLAGMRAADALAILVVQPLVAAAIGWVVLAERFDASLAISTLALLAAAALRSWRPSAGSNVYDQPSTQEKNT